MSLAPLLEEADRRRIQIVWRPTRKGWACSRFGDFLGTFGTGPTGAAALADLLRKIR